MTENTTPRTVAGKILLRGQRLAAPVPILRDITGAAARDPHDVETIVDDEAFRSHVHDLAAELGRSREAVRKEAVGHLREMSATHGKRTGRAFRRFSQWLARAHDVYVDEDSIARLRALDRQHSLLFLFSHRSYLDGALVPEVIARGRMSLPFTFGRANLNFFPMGSIASRSGVIFIKRNTGDIPVYRLALRGYIARLLTERANLAWSIEGGRTRTGKLRPPAFGILRYVADAVTSTDGVDAMVVPVSIVYDQLHEVSMMTSEARGASKQPASPRICAGSTASPASSATGWVGPTSTSGSRSRSRTGWPSCAPTRPPPAPRSSASPSRAATGSTARHRSRPPRSSAWRSWGRTGRCR